eukprot:1138304-Pelagomonas_calceolata.AAC.3
MCKYWGGGGGGRSFGGAVSNHAPLSSDLLCAQRSSFLYMRVCCAVAPLWRHGHPRSSVHHGDCGAGADSEDEEIESEEEAEEGEGGGEQVGDKCQDKKVETESAFEMKNWCGGRWTENWCSEIKFALIFSGTSTEVDNSPLSLDLLFPGFLSQT